MAAKQFVTQIFERWQQGDSKPFFDALAPDVIWTAKGSTPISGTVKSKAEYFAKIYNPLLSIFAGPTSCQIVRILAEGDIVVVEWRGETPTTSGSTYSNDYCWLIRVSPDATSIQEVVGYFDTARVDQLFPHR
jgi:ketosteroid isomerase-like protein